MAAAAQPLRQRVSFRLNQTTRVTIESPGAQQDGREGPEYRYFLSDEQIMWVPPNVHSHIVRTGAQFPITVEITKHKEGWEVVHVAEEPANGYGKASPTRSAPAQQPAPAQQQHPGHGSANGKPADLSTAQRALPETTGQPFSASMFTCLCAAIRVAAEAEKFAASIEHPVAFATSDIRAMAATLFIDARGGRA